MNKGYTHDTRVLKKTQEDEQIIKSVSYLLDKKKPFGSRLVGVALVGIFEDKFNPMLHFLNLSEVAHLPERIVDGAIKDLAKHCMRQFGRTPPKLIGEKDAKEE